MKTRSIPVLQLAASLAMSGFAIAQCPNAWSPLGPGLTLPFPGSTPSVTSFTSLPNGDLVAGGSFSDGANMQNVARWDGASWSAIGTGVSTGVNAVATLPNGDLVVGGSFSIAGGQLIHRIARWNGTSWGPLGTLPGTVTVLTNLSNGVLVAAGYFAPHYWNGATWVRLAPGGPDENDAVWCALPMPNGDLIVGGSFVTVAPGAPHYIARWSNGTYHGIGSGLMPGPVSELTRWGPNGFVAVSVAAGVPYLMEWNGAAWSTFGNWSWPGAPVYALATLPNGDVVAGGEFSSIGGVSANGLARWDGTTWHALATGTTGRIHALRLRPQGQLVVGGSFTPSGGGSDNVAEIVTSCPPAVGTGGAGCVGPGGNNLLVADTLPWVDALFRATGTGLPTTSLVLTLTSVTPVAQGAAPLTLVFPQAGVGCDILTMPDILGVLVTTTGTAQSEFFLPNSPPLVGVTFYHQMLPIELDAQGAWVSVTATNSLQLTAGAF